MCIVNFSFTIQICSVENVFSSLLHNYFITYIEHVLVFRMNKNVYSLLKKYKNSCLVNNR